MRPGWIAIAAMGLMLVACGQPPSHPSADLTSPAVSPSTVFSPAVSASPSAAPSAMPTAIPSAAPVECSVPQPLQDVCVGRAATTQEQQAMLAAARPSVESKYGLKPIAMCQNGDSCFIVRNPLLAIVGTNAAVFGGAIGRYPQGGLGCGALVFLSQDSAGWHYVNSG